MKKSLVFLTAFAALFLAGVSTNALAADADAEPKEAAVAAEEAKPTLFEEIGGHDAVKAAVDGFYEKVLADDRVNGFFKGVDMDRQRAMQTAFLTFAFGGPNAYEGKNLRAAHAHLVAKGLNDTHFDIILEHLGATLKELGVKDELIQQAADVANSVRGDILGK
nr:group 1 truncated hemoglobin [Candidatus Electrothrix aestuarii]